MPEVLEAMANLVLAVAQVVTAVTVATQGALPMVAREATAVVGASVALARAVARVAPVVMAGPAVTQYLVQLGMAGWPVLAVAKAPMA